MNTSINMIGCLEECRKQQDKCKDILYNFSDRTCLINANFIGTNPRNVQNNDKWIMLSKNRPSFNRSEFKFALIGRNKQLAQEHEQLITLTQTFPKSSDNDGLNECLSLCLEHNNVSNTCNLVQVERSIDSIECKLYQINLLNQTINSEDVLFSNLYLVTLNRNFDQNELDQMPEMDAEDALNCELDKESILLELLYLKANNQSTKYLQRRYKRGWAEDAWNGVSNWFSGMSIILNHFV